MTTKNAIEAAKITKELKNFTLDVENFAIPQGFATALIGENGAGKTTIFNLLTKVYTPTRGTIVINGMDTSGKNTVQINKMGVARTFQNIRLFSNLTVEDNVRIGLHNREKYTTASGILRLPSYWKKEKAMHEKAMELLSIFGMEDTADWQAGSLPYGAQRRLEIVRALATNTFKNRGISDVSFGDYRMARNGNHLAFFKVFHCTAPSFFFLVGTIFENRFLSCGLLVASITMIRTIAYISIL